MRTKLSILTISILFILSAFAFVPDLASATFPTIAATNTSTNSTNTLTHTVSLPADISADDLLIVFFSTDGDNTCTWSDSFIEIFEMSNGLAASLSIAYKFASGSEGATITVTTSESEKSAHASYRITGHHATQAPEVSTGSALINDAYPDPDSLTPTGGAKDYLWIAVEGNDDDDTVSAYPTNYGLSQLNSLPADPGGCGLGVAGRNLNADAEDPGTFTLSAAEQWIACTVAVHPVSVVTPASLTVTLRKSDNQQERIDVGTWGNMTVSPGATNQQSSNFVRAQCDDCDGDDDSFWVNWSGTTWDSAKVGDSITIDSNYRLFSYETTSGTADPDDGGWSWTDGGVDADGNFQITFANSGTTYVWVKFQIEAIPSPLGGSDDYEETYVVTLDR